MAVADKIPQHDVAARTVLPVHAHVHAVAAVFDKRQPLDRHVMAAEELDVHPPFGFLVRGGRIVRPVHTQRGAVAADFHVLRAPESEERVGQPEVFTLLRDHFHAALEHDFAVGASEERTRDPRRRLPVDHDLPRAGVKRLLEDFGGVGGIESE